MVSAIAIPILIILLFVIGMKTLKRRAKGGSSSTDIENLDLALEAQVSRISGGRDSSSAADQLLSCVDQLSGILRKRLTVAVDEWDHPTILRFVKLFKPLGLEEEGLEVFLSYLRNVVSTRFGEEFEKSMERLYSHSGVDFVACLTNLLKDIVSAIEENDEILRYLSGEYGIALAIWELQREYDSGFTCILDVLHSEINKITGDLLRLRKFAPYMIGRHLPLREIDFYLKEMLRLGAFEIGEPLLEIGEIEFYLEEMTHLIQLREDYMETMSFRITSLTLVDPELRRRATQKNVKKAIQIDEFMPDCRISSMVGDVFYVLWKSCTRALSTSNISLVIPVVRCSVTLLKSVYSDALKPNFEENIELPQIAMALNNLEASNKNALDLCQRIEERCRQVFPTLADCETDEYMANSVDEIRHHFKGRLDDGICRLVNLVKSQINTIFGSFTRGSEGEAIYGDDNPWVQMVIYVLEANVASIEPLLSATNYDTIVNSLICFIVSWLRDNIFILNFGKGGHEQLPRDISKMASYLSSMTPEWPIEDPVGTQMFLLDATVIPQIETVLESVKTMNAYGEAIYDESNPGIQRLIDALLINVVWLEPLTTAANYDTFVYSVIVFIVTWLHDGIFTLRFNESGHKQLLRDISMLSTHLSSVARRSIEDILDVLMEKIAAIVALQIEPVLEGVRTIGSDYPAIYDDEPSPWLQRLMDALETNVAGLQPLMLATSYDTFVYFVIDFVVTRLERIVISLEFNEGVQEQLPRDMGKLIIHLSRMTFRPMEFQLSTLKHLASYGTYKPVMLHWPTERLNSALDIAKT